MLHTDPNTFPQILQFHSYNQNVRKTPAEKILCAACDLISENGYHAFSLVAVARWAGVSFHEVASTWSSKEALLSDTLDFALNIPVFRQDEQDRLHDMSAEALKRSCKRALLGWAKANAAPRMRRLFKALAPAMAETPELFEFMSEYTEQRSASFVSLFRQAIARGIVRNDLDISDLVAISIGAIHYKICIRGDRPDAVYMNSIYDILFSVQSEVPIAANQNAI